MCARFGRMVASVGPAVTSAATACVVRSRDAAARTACASPCRCVRPSGACRRRSGTAMTGTWWLATQPASGAAIRIASPMLAGRRVATQHSGRPPSNLTQLPIRERAPHELLDVERVRRPGQGGRASGDQMSDERPWRAGRRILAIPSQPGEVARSQVGRYSAPQGQRGFREYGVPKTAASVAEGSSLRTTTSIASPDRSTRVKSRYRP